MSMARLRGGQEVCPSTKSRQAPEPPPAAPTFNDFPSPPPRPPVPTRAETCSLLLRTAKTTAPSAAQVPTSTTCQSAVAQRRPHPARGSAQRAVCAAPQSPHCAAPSRPAPAGPFCKYTLIRAIVSLPQYRSRGTRAGRSRSPHPPAQPPRTAYPRGSAAPTLRGSARSLRGGWGGRSSPRASCRRAGLGRTEPCRAGQPTRGKTEGGGCAEVARSLRGRRR